MLFRRCLIGFGRTDEVAADALRLPSGLRRPAPARGMCAAMIASPGASSLPGRAAACAGTAWTPTEVRPIRDNPDADAGRVPRAATSLPLFCLTH